MKGLKADQNICGATCISDENYLLVAESFRFAEKTFMMTMFKYVHDMESAG